MRQLTIGSLFSGIGGFDLGLERAGMRVIWQSEIDPYASAVLRKHWPMVPNHGDIRAIHFPPVERCDVLCGGFPCQDISNAGERAGIDGCRSGLWAEFGRLVCELRPRYVLVENVAALLGRGLERVLGDLAALGYDAEWSVLSACRMGAPHMRERVFIVAYADSEHGWTWFRDSFARAERALQTDDGSPRARTGWLARLANPSALYRNADGVSDRMDRNRAIGNAIVPQVAEVIGRAIVESS